MRVPGVVGAAGAVEADGDRAGTERFGIPQRQDRRRIRGIGADAPGESAPGFEGLAPAQPVDDFVDQLRTGLRAGGGQEFDDEVHEAVR